MTTRTASPAQTNLLHSLCDQIAALDADHPEAVRVEFADLSVGEASDLISAKIATVKALKTAGRKPAAAKPEFHLHPGLYTVVRGGDRRTFRVEVQPSDAKFAPGETILSYLSGSDNTGDYTSMAFVVGSALRVFKRYRESAVVEFAEALMADPDAALVAKHCARCGRTLTTPESIAAGFGPECASKGLR